MTSHEPSGAECTVGHIAYPGDDGGQCHECKHCRKMIRPHRMNEDCPARSVEPARPIVTREQMLEQIAHANRVIATWPEWMRKNWLDMSGTNPTPRPAVDNKRDK